MRAAAELRNQIEAALAGRVPAALSPRPLHSPELLSCGVAEVDALLGGGLPLGAIVEFTGAPSSGRTTLALLTLAAITREGHCCAYVDPSDALDPLSAAATGMDLQRLLWVRAPVRAQPSRALEAALRATDLLLNAGGFRAVVLDLAEVPAELARRIPMTTWYRFRLQAEKSRTLLLVMSTVNKVSECHPERSEGPLQSTKKQSRPKATSASEPRSQFLDKGNANPYVQSCATLILHCDPASPGWHQPEPQSPPLLTRMHYRVNVQRSRATLSIPKKRAASQTAWQCAMSWTG